MTATRCLVAAPNRSAYCELLDGHGGPHRNGRLMWPEPSAIETMMYTRSLGPLNALADEVHAANAKWWYRADGTRMERNKGELLMLVVTEVAEAMEGERKNLMDDKLPHRRMAEVEIVDAIVRLLDYACAQGYDLDAAYHEKMAFNAQREDHKREAAQIAAERGSVNEEPSDETARLDWVLDQINGIEQILVRPESTLEYLLMTLGCGSVTREVLDAARSSSREAGPE